MRINRLDVVGGVIVDYLAAPFGEGLSGLAIVVLKPGDAGALGEDGPGLTVMTGGAGLVALMMMVEPWEFEGAETCGDKTFTRGSPSFIPRSWAREFIS